MSKDRIAIVGIGCRFPGGINDTEAFWKLLVEGGEALTDVPADRFNVERFYDPEPGVVGKTIARRGGFLDQVDLFDPQFFGISPREAAYVDPQQRLLLETAWEAIEDAGLVLDLENGTDLAVYVGISHNDYQGIQGSPFDHTGVSQHSPTGSAHSIAANRISYALNLKGPSVAMDTACSSALTAVHAACEHIWAGRGDQAMAGGVTVMISPNGFIGFSQAGMLSPEGRCAAFSGEASGFVRGEGAGMVLLKRLSKALEDGDPIHGVIVGTALNQDGHTNGISLPSPEAQARLVKDACKDAGVDPKEIDFVEAHGTGTAVGDPIEAHALAEALCAERTEPLPIGSVKTNVGHLETAAGVAGLVKAALVLKHGIIPPSLHFKTPSPHIDFPKLKLRVPVENEPLPEKDGERMAGVNSFGFGGANAHVILAEPPVRHSHDHGETYAERPWPLMVSARSETALKNYAGRLANWLDEHSHLNGSSPLLPDLTYTLGARRNHHSYRLTLTASTMPEAIAELKAFAAGEASVKVQSSFSPRREEAPRVGFIMSGQGPQWWGMGRELMRSEPVFRQMMERCAAGVDVHARFKLLEELGRSEAQSQMSRTEIAQPAIFAMQVSLAELWKSWGLEPAAIVGHSVGEIAAACVAGVLSVEEAARVITLRARFMDGCARGAGTMLAVGLPEEEALALIARHDRTAKIAAYNGPRSLTISGPRISLEAMVAELEAQGVFARLVKVDHPFHHPLMEPAASELQRTLADLEPHPETVPFFSTVTGGQVAGPDCTARHWGNGIRHPVLFAPAVSALAEFGVDVWLEISSHPALVHSIRECLADQGGKPVVVASARREREHESILESALELHRASVPLNFAGLTPSRRLLSLPAYAWERSRWWNESPEWREGRLAAGGKGLLDVKLPQARPTWSCHLDSRHMAYLKDHKVDSHVIFPAAGFIDLILEAGVHQFEGRPFVVEDFEIRKPLLLPEPAHGVRIEVAYDPNDRTFSIQSKLEGSASWSLHVVGSMRGERVDSSFASATYGKDREPGLVRSTAEELYQHMSDLGLRYGDEFRSVREIAAGHGKSTGTVALTEASAKRAAEYPLHPVLMDGALHVFSAGAATVEDRTARMKLPVRFGRILFLRSPGESALIEAAVQDFSEEFLEGRVAIYDKTGAPCVLVDGFRAIAVSGLRRGSSGGQSGVLYHLDWQRTPASAEQAPLAPVALTALRDAGKAALDDVLSVRGRDEIENAMAASDELAAARIARGLREMLADATTFNAESLRIAAPMKQVFERLVAALVKRGWIKKTAAKFEVTPAFEQAASGADAVLRKYLDDHSGHLPEALLCVGNTAELGPILRAEKDAVQVLFAGSGAELLDQFYGDGLLTSHWLAAIGAAVQAAAKALPEGRGLRILEIGAGTGGLAAQVLPLLERGLHSYTFTDVSAAFFSGAMQKLASFPEVETKIFDLEKPGTAQELEAGSFDFIIGTNVLHAVKDVRAALRHLEALLRPGGTLAFMDTATPALWTDSVFGLTSGWWRFTDRDLRTEHPLLSRDQWEKAMREAGFAETASIPGLKSPVGGEGQIGLFGRKAWNAESASAVIPDTQAIPSEKSWLIFADETGLGDQLATQLRASGSTVKIARRLSASAAPRGSQSNRAKRPISSADEYTVAPENLEDFKSLLTNAGEIERITYLWNLDAPTSVEAADPALSTDALFHLAQALELVRPAAKIRLDSITRGAQPAGQNETELAIAQAPSIGLLRVIFNEYPNLACRSIDLPPQASSHDEALLWRELLRTETERETALRGEARYVQRIAHGRPALEKAIAPEVPLRLVSRERGHLDTLRFTPFSLPALEAGQVLIETKAAGMNFRDVLKALALYPGEAPDARIFGDEIGGLVKAVGSGVTHVKPGDRVFGLAVFGLATETLARGGDVARIPADLTFEEAATLPVVFMTAWHALNNVARIRPGETVLVHAGAGGVGMAAIQIAHHLGAHVIASAGSATKRTLLETLGVKHVIDSRRGDFAEGVMELTNRKGVDCVLNALASEAIPMGLACLAEFGRFIEIGKRDIYLNSRIPLFHLRKNASFHVVAMDAVFSGDEELTRGLMRELSELVEQGAIKPLPYRAFPACRVDAAFRLMAGGKHIGKVVVSFPETFVPRRGEPLPPGFEVKADATYAITGGFGGFGKVLSRWLADRGAKHLVLSSRNGAATPEQQAFVESMTQRGVEVRVVKADAGSPADIQRLVKEANSGAHPLRGLFHLAMAIDDAPLAVLDRDRMETVIRPKAYGAWLLHEATKNLPLDAFVMFSSVSSIFGNPAQGNYGAANAFLDALAHHRHALGLPALAVNWGVLGGEGYVARNERVAEFLARQGTHELSPGEVTSILESSLAAGDQQVMAIRVDWSKWRQSFRSMSENPMLERIFASLEGEETGAGASDWRVKIEAAPADQREAVIADAVRDVVGTVLRVKPETLRNDQPLTDLGLDSLMGVEIENNLEKATGVSLPPTSLMRARTIGQIAALINGHMGGTATAASAPATAPVVVENATAEEVDLDALTDADLDQLLGEEAQDPVA